MKPRASSTAAQRVLPTPHSVAGSSDGPTLNSALEALQSLVATSHDLRLDLPHDGALRMRNLVHRGTQRPVFKVPSVKLDRPVQCESILEYETAVLLDVSPQVTGFAEQPARIHFLVGGEWRTHIPDFAILAGERKVFLENKFAKDVDDLVLARTASMKASLGRHGWEYHLLTEVNVRRGSVVTNALGILRRARHSVCEVRSLHTLERLRNSEGHTLGDFAWSDTGSPIAICLAQLITGGHAVVDMIKPHNDTSPICVTNTTNKGAAQWLSALFA